MNNLLRAGKLGEAAEVNSAMSTNKIIRLGTNEEFDFLVRCAQIEIQQGQPVSSIRGYFQQALPLVSKGLYMFNAAISFDWFVDQCIALLLDSSTEEERKIYEGHLDMILQRFWSIQRMRIHVALPLSWFIQVLVSCL